MLSGRGLCDGLITHPEESHQLWCVVVCDLENLKNEEAIVRNWAASAIGEKSSSASSCSSISSISSLFFLFLVLVLVSRFDPQLYNVLCGNPPVNTRSTLNYMGQTPLLEVKFCRVFKKWYPLGGLEYSLHVL